MKKRYLIVLAILAVITGLIGLGINRQHVMQAAQSLEAKDKVGDNIAADMNSLNQYVHGHTRASVTFSLDSSYQRAVESAEQAAAPTANSAVYNAAIKICQVRNPVTTAQCIENYVQSHAAPGTQPHPAVLPDHNAYVYHLTSPAWAPDLPGLSFLAAAILLALTLWFSLFKPTGRRLYFI